MVSEAREAALSVVRRLREAGHVAYFAGGCVRDELLGLEPKDFDVATDATPDRIESVFSRTARVGAAFGVVLVRQGGRSIEVATFRSDGPYSDRRRPDHVVFSTPEADARRRDFTINALFLDPLEGDRVIDFVGGQDDLRVRLIRAVGDPEARLAEDHLRALRGVRLAARLGFAIEEATAGSIRRHASDLRGVSRERIGEELRKMMGHATRVRAVELIEGLGLDAPVLEETAQRCRRLAALGCLEGKEAGFGMTLAAWSMDRSAGGRPEPGIVDRLRRALALSNEERSELSGTLRLVEEMQGGWRRLSVAARRRMTDEAVFLGSVWCLRGVDEGLATEIEAEARAWGRNPEPWVTGEDLVGLGLKPSPRYKTLLGRVYDAQLEGRVRTREEALELLSRWVV